MMAKFTSSSDTPAPPNIRLMDTGPKPDIWSLMKARYSALSPIDQAGCFAGVSCTDSPQPQADVWLGLLKTKPDFSFSTR